VQTEVHSAWTRAVRVTDAEQINRVYLTRMRQSFKIVAPGKRIAQKSMNQNQRWKRRMKARPQPRIRGKPGVPGALAFEALGWNPAGLLGCKPQIPHAMTAERVP